MLSASPYALVAEMLEAPDVIRRFDKDVVSAWADAIDQQQKLFISGEGSSRIFPSKNLISRAFASGSSWAIHTEGGRQAAEYDLEGFVVLAASNSGQTRELIALLDKLGRDGVERYGVTATAGSRMTEVVDDARILNCGTEKAVASSKTVIEQALVYQSLLRGGEWSDQEKAANYCADILSKDVPAEIADYLASAPIIYFAGRNDGVAEELALKTGEIARKKAVYLEGTYVLHGIEEVMRKGETLVLIEPFKEEIEKYKSILKDSVGLNVAAIASFDTPFPTIKIPSLSGFDGYLRLMAGWNILVAAGLALNVNLDKPERARKIGNAV